MINYIPPVQQEVKPGESILMSKSGVNWYRVYCIFTAIRVLIGLVNNEGFRPWLMQYLIGTVILAIIMAVDRSRS